MQVISIDEILNYKVLPVDIYTEKGKVIFAAGEILTPGKVLQLKYMPAIYIEEVGEEEQEFIENDDDILDILNEFSDFQEEGFEESESEELPVIKPKFLRDYSREKVLEQAQDEIKHKYKEMLDSFSSGELRDCTPCIEIRDTIIEEIIPEVSRIFYKSQLKVYGDYNYSHGINVAMLSALLAHKMKYSEQAVKDITLAAILHDIGETEIPDAVLNKELFTESEERLVQLHTKLGYNIIKNELGLPENIAKVALQHHERPDGSGYPYGISGKLITTESYIVSLCDEYDKLTSGKANIKVKTAKDAVKHLLETGTKQFKSEVLYTFVHMTNYHDVRPLR